MNEDELGESEAEENSEQERAIKVTDRRLFDDRGNLRHAADDGDDDSVATTTEANEPTPQEATAGNERTEVTSSVPPTPPPDPQTAEPSNPVKGLEGEPLAGSTAADLPRDFAAFVQSQYFEAMLYMGAVAHPQTGESVKDLPLAQYKIDVLSMLKEKTENNLDADEARLLEEVLHQLRIVYLETRKALEL